MRTHMVIFLLLVLAAITLGLIGTTAEGLGYLLIIGIVVLVIALAYGGVRLTHRVRGRPGR
ncbi:hypothetical protein GCM10020367_22790 [Streptomyces sannanensis]|uniref:DUF2207 domain-containing protein n=2 Tax=Streptomyces sannanensis TaxID=285536 RepID=A0ABP6S9X9_9ACTN